MATQVPDVISDLNEDSGWREQVERWGPKERRQYVLNKVPKNYHSKFYEVLGDVTLPVLDVVSTMYGLPTHMERQEFFARNFFFLEECFLGWAHRYIGNSAHLDISEETPARTLLGICNLAVRKWGAVEGDIDDLETEYLAWLGDRETVGFYEQEEVAPEFELRETFRTLKETSMEDVLQARRDGNTRTSPFIIANVYRYFCMVGQAQLYGPVIIEEHDLKERETAKIRIGANVGIENIFTHAPSPVLTLAVREMPLDDYVWELMAYRNNRYRVEPIPPNSFGAIFKEQNGKMVPMPPRDSWVGRHLGSTMHFLYSPNITDDFEGGVPQETIEELVDTYMTFFSLGKGRGRVKKSIFSLFPYDILEKEFIPPFLAD